jgi:hypothetical protein
MTTTTNNDALPDSMFYYKYYSNPTDKDDERKQVSRFSKIRLMKDLKELQQNVLPTIYAHPLEKDIFEWFENYFLCSLL